MTIWYKQGTSGKLNNQIQKAKGRVASLYGNKYNEDLFVTCLCEGNHSLGTLHEFGDAIDFRYGGPTPGEIREAAGPGFDFAFHDSHIHMEYDPKC